jgi:hypothetical protein
MAMHHTAVQSSNIKSVGYDDATRELEVHFHGGNKYRYANVDPRTHQQLVSAKSVGAHFHQHIRGSFKASQQ